MITPRLITSENSSFDQSRPLLRTELRVVQTDGVQETVTETFDDPSVVEATLRYARTLARSAAGLPERRSDRCRGWHVWTPDRPGGFDVASTAELTRVVGSTRESIFSALARNKATIPPAGLMVPPGVPGIAVKGCYMVEEPRWIKFQEGR